MIHYSRELKSGRPRQPVGNSEATLLKNEVVEEADPLRCTSSLDEMQRGVPSQEGEGMFVDAKALHRGDRVLPRREERAAPTASPPSSVRT